MCHLDYNKQILDQAISLASSVIEGKLVDETEIFNRCEAISQEYQKRIRENYILKTELISVDGVRDIIANYYGNLKHKTEFNFTELAEKIHNRMKGEKNEKI